MTIKDATYGLCKEIIRSSDRTRVREILFSLNTGSEWGRFGYRARQLRAQFLAYLVLDERRDDLQELGPLPSLEPEAMRIIAPVHQALSGLNDSCLLPLKDSAEDFVPIADPYARFGTLQSAEDNQEKYPLPGSTAILIEEFRSHPAFAITEAAFRIVKEEVTNPTTIEAVDSVEALLLRTGPFECPKQVEAVAFASPRDSKERVVYRFLVGLLTLRTSLWVLNELLYQAFWTEKLPFISEDSIVKLGPITSTIAGMGVSLIATPRQLESPSDPQLFLYKVPDDALPDIGLCRMELQSHSYSADYGDTIEISARAVDDNLNPYGPLLKHL